jgi:hypothetical protein
MEGGREEYDMCQMQGTIRTCCHWGDPLRMGTPFTFAMHKASTVGKQVDKLK